MMSLVQYRNRFCANKVHRSRSKPTFTMNKGRSSFSAAFIIMCFGALMVDTKSITLQEIVIPSIVSCYSQNGAVPMVGDVPNPDNCREYYTCVPGPSGRFEAISRACQPGQPDSPLYYDFQNCQCNYGHAARCFDSNNATHIANRFVCASAAKLSNSNIIPPKSN